VHVVNDPKLGGGEQLASVKWPLCDCTRLD
jgi:hypothetical protein